MQKSTDAAAVPADPDELVDLGLRQHVDLRAAFAAGERISLADLGSARRLVAEGRRELAQQEARRQKERRIQREKEARRAEVHAAEEEEIEDALLRAAEELGIDLSGVRSHEEAEAVSTSGGS